MTALELKSSRVYGNLEAGGMYIQFRIGSQSYAISFDEVHEVIPSLSSRSIPSRGEIIRGVFSYRHDSIILIDLPKYLGLENFDEYFSTFIIIVHEGIKFALPANVMEEVLHFKREISSSSDQVRVEAVLVHDSKQIYLLNVAAIAQRPELRELASAIVNASQAPDLPTTHAQSNQHHSLPSNDYEQNYVTFRLGELLYATPLLDIKSFLGGIELVPVPAKNLSSAGLFNLHGKVAQAIDLRSIFGEPKLDQDRATMLLYETFLGPIGVVVGEVLGIELLDDRTFEPLIDSRFPIDRAHFYGTVNVSNRPVTVVDVNFLVSHSLEQHA